MIQNKSLVEGCKKGATIVAPFLFELSLLKYNLR
jgi:hypothetical protein